MSHSKLFLKTLFMFKEFQPADSALHLLCPKNVKQNNWDTETRKLMLFTVSYILLVRTMANMTINPQRHY